MLPRLTRMSALSQLHDLLGLRAVVQLRTDAAEEDAQLMAAEVSSPPLHLSVSQWPSRVPPAPPAKPLLHLAHKFHPLVPGIASAGVLHCERYGAALVGAGGGALQGLH